MRAVDLRIAELAMQVFVVLGGRRDLIIGDVSHGRMPFRDDVGPCFVLGRQGSETKTARVLLQFVAETNSLLSRC